MNWYTHLEVFIDPSLKSFDKEFYLRCEQKFLELDFKLITSIKNLKSSQLPQVLILFNEIPQLDLINDYKNIIVQYKKPNLDLFEEKYPQNEVFEIEKLDDFLLSWDFFIDSISLNLKVLEHDLVDSRKKYTNKIFTKSHINNFDDEEQRDSLTQFEKYLYLKNPLEKNEFQDLFKHFFAKEEIEILTIAEVFIYKKHTDVIPIQYVDGHYLFISSNLSRSLLVKVTLIIESYFKHLDLLNSFRNEANNWNQIIELVNIPIVLLDELGHPLIHNREFSKISFSIAECLKLENNQQISIEDKLYRVILNKNLRDKTALIFFPVSEYLSQSENPSSTELGIISSSIAHELNNPLGGILAAIDVLMLDELDREVLEHLEEMKRGVTRCKKLVETFLGFSRFRTREFDSTKMDFSLQESIQQAMELVRFRLIENNLTIDLQYKTQEKLERNFNPHILSMIFYLIFGEVITNFSHYNLVKGEKGQKVVLGFIENQRGLAVDFPNSVEITKDLTQIKLMSHLLEGENIRTKVSEQSLEFFF